MPGKERRPDQRMIAVEESASDEAGAQNQEHSAFFAVIAHQGHGPGDKSQYGDNGLEQGVQLFIALPRGAVGGNATEKQDYGENDVDEAPSTGAVWP